MRPRTTTRSAFATKCMVLAAYLTVNMGIGCMIAVTTAWFWWVYMMMGILLFLLGVRITIFALSLTSLVQCSRRHKRQKKQKAARAAALAVTAMPDQNSNENLLQQYDSSQQSQLTGCSSTGSVVQSRDSDNLQHSDAAAATWWME